jgi:hypothetical protein
MTCRSLPPLTEDAIVDVARGRQTGRGTVAAVEAHVEHCAACAARLSREREVTEGLRALAAATASAAPSEALEERLRAAFEAQHPPASPAWWKVAAAAAALVAAGGVWWTSREASPPLEVAAGVSASPTTATATPTPAGGPEAAAPAREHTVRDDAAVQVRRSERRRPERPRAAPSDNDFVALPAAVGLPPFESGVIVRMELPLAALPAYGLEMVPGRRTPVEADLLIGQDGQARAIRLVSRSAARSGAEQ